MISIEQYENDNKRIAAAIAFATEKHASQVRKGSGLPYIVHPMEVWTILRENNCNVNVQIAGLLHDTLEDTDTTPEKIDLNFGLAVRALVETESEDKSKTWKERKQHTIDALAEDTIETMMVCCADKLSNLRSMAYDIATIGDKLWERFNAPKEDIKWYYGSIAESLSPLSELKMHKELCELVKIVFH